MKHAIGILLLMVSLGPVHAAVHPFADVEGILRRRAPWLLHKVIFEKIGKKGGQDVFELESVKGHVIVRASGANEAAMGVNWYLKYYCHRSMSHMGDNLSPVKVLPPVDKKVTKTSCVPIRYALNYCTISYSMCFSGWEEWERELDWMALSGVNLALVPVGVEAVWQGTMRRMGFSEEDIRGFICGPGYTAWWLMGNLEGWGGPVTQDMIDRQTMLEQKILRRMRGLGIEPVMHGFYGMVPRALGKRGCSGIIRQGKWAGGFERPDYLLPTDTLFPRIAGIYYEEMKKLYGKDLRYFAGDPFHEGGSAEGVDVAGSARAIQGVMQRYFPGSTWVLQAWQNNPTDQLLSGLDRSRTLVVELSGENKNNWERRMAFGGTPFVWSIIDNAGDKTGLYGRLQHMADEVYRARKSDYGKFLKGIGITPEGIVNNPVVYDLVLELPWHSDHLSVENWIGDYVQYRYGQWDSAIHKSWQMLLQTVYSSPQTEGSTPEAIFCSRPSMSVLSPSTWGTRKREYDTLLFEKAVAEFAKASPKLRKLETYRTDRVDLLRQVLANRGEILYERLVHTWKENDGQGFHETVKKFRELMLQDDSLLSSSAFFSLDTWLGKAKNFGKTESEAVLALMNARTQISYWGSDIASTDLADYANKEWSGMLSGLYLQRWDLFFRRPDATTEDYFKLEKSWALTRGSGNLPVLTGQRLEGLIERLLVKAEPYTKKDE